jgi:hypothetical protein
MFDSVSHNFSKLSMFMALSTVCHSSADKLQAAYEAIGFTGIAVETGPANFAVQLNTPKVYRAASEPWDLVGAPEVYGSSHSLIWKHNG